jgi:hypothetical protein
MTTNLDISFEDTTLRSSGATMSMLKPFRIARAVLPVLWMYVSVVRGI